MPDPVPADLPRIVADHLDDEIGDRLRDTRSIAELVNTDPGGGYSVPVEPVDWERPIQDTGPL